MPKSSKTSDRDSQELRVTVVIPCHNHADLVLHAIESVIKQDYPFKSIVVIDDGSKDNPKKAIEKNIGGLSLDEFKAAVTSETPVTLLVNPIATGPSAARNQAINAAWEQTDVFMMLDADDLYLPGKIEKSVQKYAEDPKRIGIVYTDAIIENINTHTKIHELRRPFDRIALERECIISNTPLISKPALATCGGYDESMRTCEDWDLWLRITEKFVAIHIPEPLHVYSVTGKNSSDVVPIEVWQQNWAKIRQRMMERRNG